MTENIIETIEKFKMISPGNTVVAAVSGGADSIAMLHFLNDFCLKRKIKLYAAHVNHGLRGEESDRDEEFVRRFCLDNDIKVHILKTNIENDRKKGESLETCGRRIRYDFFYSVLKNLLAEDGKIATAHTKNDCTETMILNLTRGAGIKGLCGIPAKRDNIIRPMIDCTRQEIEEYINENGLTYVEDSSNNDTCFSRNRIRKNVIPELLNINPSLFNVLKRDAEHIKEDSNFLDLLSENAEKDLAFPDNYYGIKYPVSDLLEIPKPLRTRVFFIGFHKVSGLTLEANHIKMLENLLISGGQITLSGGFFAKITEKNLVFFKDEKSEDFFFSEEDLRKSKCHLQNRTFFGRISDTVHSPNVYKNLLNIAIDYDTIKGKLCVRSRIEKDSITLPGRPKKTLKKLFNESKIPIYQRNRLVILADDDGVLAVEGFGADIRAQVTENTKKVFALEISETEI